MGLVRLNAFVKLLKVAKLNALCGFDGCLGQIPYSSVPFVIAVGRPSMIRVDSTLTWTMRLIAVTRSRGSANQPLG